MSWSCVLARERPCRSLERVSWPSPVHERVSRAIPEPQAAGVLSQSASLIGLLALGRFILRSEAGGYGTLREICSDAKDRHSPPARQNISPYISHWTWMQESLWSGFCSPSHLHQQSKSLTPQLGMWGGFQYWTEVRSTHSLPQQILSNFQLGAGASGTIQCSKQESQSRQLQWGKAAAWHRKSEWLSDGVSQTLWRETISAAS